jgi:hypothetical protein
VRSATICAAICATIMRTALCFSALGGFVATARTCDVDPCIIVVLSTRRPLTLLWALPPFICACPVPACSAVCRLVVGGHGLLLVCRAPRVPGFRGAQNVSNPTVLHCPLGRLLCPLSTATHCTTGPHQTKTPDAPTRDPFRCLALLVPPSLFDYPREALSHCCLFYDEQ